jgi:hypothetical protein
MARFSESFYSPTAAALVTAINTFLATLVNPTIRQLEFSLVRNDGTIGDEYSVLLRYDDGGAALATPFLVRLDEAQSLAAAETLLQAFMTANAAYFIGATALQVADGEQTFKKNSLLTIYNVTGGASANYTPL